MEAHVEFGKVADGTASDQRVGNDDEHEAQLEGDDFLEILFSPKTVKRKRGEMARERNALTRRKKVFVVKIGEKTHGKSVFIISSICFFSHLHIGRGMNCFLENYKFPHKIR